MSLSSLSVAALAALSSAQASFPETEPNSVRAEATAASCLVAGDFLTGTTTGTTTTAGSTAATSVDLFRVQTCALPTGVIYRHRLVITTAGAVGHTGTIRGLDVVNTPPQTITATDVALQTSTTTSTPPRFNQWYGFGRQEEIYWRISGAAATTGAYTATLVTDVVTPTALSSTVVAGSVLITTVGQGHTTDTEIHVFDANFRPIPGFRNDDEPGTTALMSRLTRTYAPGTYYVAIARFNLCENLLTGADDDFLTGDVLDFADAVVGTSTTTGSNCQFAITDSAGTITQAAALPASPFEVLWFRMDVVAPASGISTYCYGDGLGSACPCGNASTTASQSGCLNSLGSGGALTATGLASVSNDTLVIQGSGMANSSALYFQGNNALAGSAGTPFGDGLRCASGGVVRLGTKTNAAGASQYPDAGDLSVSVRGLIPVTGGQRFYQVWYRNADAAFCTADTFNLTNGLSVLWAP